MVIRAGGRRNAAPRKPRNSSGGSQERPKKAPGGITTGHRLTLHGPYGAKGELGSEEKKGTRSWLRKVSDDIRARLDAKSPDGARRPDTVVRKLSEAAVTAMGGDGAPTIAALHRALG